MIITERHLRHFIREQLLLEKYIANVSDLVRVRDVFDGWADLLLDELTDKLPNGAMVKELKPKSRKAMIDGMSEAVRMYLIGAMGHPIDSYSRRRMERDEDEQASKRHRDRVMRGL
jgi:hypothetical protein